MLPVHLKLRFERFIPVYTVVIIISYDLDAEHKSCVDSIYQTGFFFYLLKFTVTILPTFYTYNSIHK